MKKVLVVLLVIGLLAGAIGAAAGVQEEASSKSFSEWNGDAPFDESGAAPCGGGDGSGGGAPG